MLTPTRLKLSQRNFQKLVEVLGSFSVNNEDQLYLGIMEPGCFSSREGSLRCISLSGTPASVTAPKPVRIHLWGKNSVIRVNHALINCRQSIRINANGASSRGCAPTASERIHKSDLTAPNCYVWHTACQTWPSPWKHLRACACCCLVGSWAMLFDRETTSNSN